MYRLAVYGKGGVGKSAVSSNLSYLLSLRGHKVLHIGCDPKHDSTRLLTGGVPQRTFLDCMVEKEGSAVQEGENGISCVECGGAEPGIGCAGKGMTAMFSYMEDHTPEGTDIRVCDVLGDVVCGGFSVPMRRNNVDGILIVVSEEFMALYAANNILRGIANLNGTPCVLGLILNSRDPQDRARAESFSAASGVPIIAEISRSSLFSRAEAAGRALCALFPDSEPAHQLNALADAAERAMAGELKGVKASPLSDRAMTQIAAGQPVTDTSGAGTRKTCGFDSYDSERGISYRGRFVMPACTSHGAFELLSGIGDAAVVMHGPRNCAFLDEYAWERETYWTSFSRGGPRACNIYSSGLDGLSSFAGDAEALRNAVMRAYADGFRWIFVVRTCASEILGSDLQSIIDDMHLEDAHVIVIPSDRKFLGSKWGCFGGAAGVLADLVDWDREPVPGTAAMLGMGGSMASTAEGRAELDRVLGAFGLRRAAGFTDTARMEDILSVSEAQYLLQVEPRGLYSKIAGAVKEHREVRTVPFMHGMRGLEGWVKALSEMTGKAGEGEAFLAAERKRYEEGLSRLRPKAAGKRALIYSRSDFDLDWHIDVLQDLGMEAAEVAHWPANFVDRGEPPSEHPEIPRAEEVPLCALREEAEKVSADLIVSGDMRAGRAGLPWTGLGERYYGADGALDWAGRIVRSLHLPPEAVAYRSDGHAGCGAGNGPGGCCG